MINRFSQTARITAGLLLELVFVGASVLGQEAPLKVGPGITPPRAISIAEPDYPKEAKAAKHEGTIVLQIVVAEDGTVRDPKIVDSLGMGLDEEAIKTVKKWKFQPAMRGGTSVPVQINVEMTFLLYRDAAEEAAISSVLSLNPTKPEELPNLTERASNGDSQAQLVLGCIYAHGIRGVAVNRVEAINWWVHAAEMNVATAQFLLGKVFQHGVGIRRDGVEAYKWFYIAETRGYTAAALALHQLEETLSSKQTKRAVEAAREWQQSHAKQGTQKQ